MVPGYRQLWNRCSQTTQDWRVLFSVRGLLWLDLEQDEDNNNRDLQPSAESESLVLQEHLRIVRLIEDQTHLFNDRFGGQRGFDRLRHDRRSQMARIAIDAG